MQPIFKIWKSLNYCMCLYFEALKRHANVTYRIILKNVLQPETFVLPLAISAHSRY